jgi:hypothetical protein
MKLLHTTLLLILLKAHLLINAIEPKGADLGEPNIAPKKQASMTNVGNKDKIKPDKNDKSDTGSDDKSHDESDDEKDDKSDGESDGEHGDESDDKDSKKMSQEKIDNNEAPAKSEKSIQPANEKTVKKTPIPEVTASKPHNTINTEVDTSKSLETSDIMNDSNSETTNTLLETSKQFINTISGMATNNNTFDAWREQSWANKTPREFVDMLETEMSIMFRDKYVHFVVLTMSIMCISFTLYVVHQMTEHPKGMLSRLCRCSVACLRIICCPLYTILCCPCCTSKNRPNTKEYSHLPTHEINDSKKN